MNESNNANNDEIFLANVLFKAKGFLIESNTKLTLKQTIRQSNGNR